MASTNAPRIAPKKPRKLHRQPRQRPGQPTLAEVIRSGIAAVLRDTHTGMPGRVESYDKAKQVADVVPVIKGVIFTEDDEQVLEALPVISNVPVGWSRGAGGSFQGKLAKGDHVWLSFSEAATAVWRKTGQISEPGDLRRHDISYAMALPCISPDADALTAINDTESWVLDGPAFLRLGGPSADFVALATKVDLAFTALAGAFSTWVVTPGDGGAALKSLLSTLAGTGWPLPTGATKVKAE